VDSRLLGNDREQKASKQKIVTFHYSLFITEYKMGSSITILENFVKTREEISDNITKLINLGKSLKMPEEIHILQEFNRKLLDNIFRIIVIGEFKRGKSTFINAMLGDKILPVGITPTTATVNIIRYGDTPKVVVNYKDKSDKEVPLEELHNYVSTKSREIEKIETVTVSYPAKICKESVEIVDSPGVNDIDEQRIEITYDYIPKCDAAIFIMNATQQFSASEREFLSQKVNKYINKIFFLLNKIDQLSETEQVEAIEYVNNEMKKITGTPKIFPVSSKLALISRQENNAEELKKSKLEEFETELFQFLIEEKGKIVLEVPIQRSFNTMEKMKFSIELQLKAFEFDLSELEERMEKANIEFAKLQAEKDEVLAIIDSKKNDLDKRLISDIKMAVYDFQNRVEIFINDNSSTDLEVIRKDTTKFLENLIQVWGKKEEEFVEKEINKLMEYIELKTINIQKRIMEIQLNFIGVENFLKDKINDEQHETPKEKNFVFDMIPDFINDKMGELSGVARGAIFIFGAAILTGGALIPAILLGSAASFITGTVLKDISTKKHKKELSLKFKESLESLPDKIIANIGGNLDEIFNNNLKKQVLNEIESIINTANNTLKQITIEKKYKESETEETKVQLNNYLGELKAIENNLTTIKNSII
jgi:GTPase SAR1 family protein